MRRRCLAAVPAALFLILLTATAASTQQPASLTVYIAKIIAKAPQQGCGDYTLFVLDISRDHSLKLGGITVSREKLEDLLGEVFKTRAERLLFIRPDPDEHSGH